jgi:hypothetical protein
VRWACGQHGKTTTTTTTCSHQRARLTRWVVASHSPCCAWLTGFEVGNCAHPLPQITNLHVVAAVAPQLRAHVVDRDHDDVSLHPKDPCCTEKNPTHYDQRWRHGASLPQTRVPTCKLSLHGFPTFQLSQVNQFQGIREFSSLTGIRLRARSTSRKQPWLHALSQLWLLSSCASMLLLHLADLGWTRRKLHESAQD